MDGTGVDLVVGGITLLLGLTPNAEGMCSKGCE